MVMREQQAALTKPSLTDILDVEITSATYHQVLVTTKSVEASAFCLADGVIINHNHEANTDIHKTVLNSGR